MATVMASIIEKPNVNVLIVLGNSLTTTKKTVDSKGNITYSGFTWDVWKKIEESLKEKYNFLVHYTPEKTTNYNLYVNDVANGKYDMVIGSFFNTKWRESKIDFTTPILIDANAILHEYNTTLWKDMQTVVLKTGRLILYLLILGIIFGSLLYIVDPQRIKTFPQFKKSKYLFYLRSVVTGIATMFGEMGFLVENPSLNIQGIILIIFIMTIAFIYIMFIQAEITTVLLNESKKKITNDTIGYKKFLGWSSDPVPQKLKRYGAIFDLQDGISMEKMIDKYLSNTNTYRGIAVPYCFGHKYLKKYPELTLSTGFGNEPSSFVISQNRRELKEDVNAIIIDLKTKLKLQQMCHSYFGDIQDIPVCSLT
tara:strand:+ start:906 stop:2003 length:1098 start_codon:yes stop_codon:yes gene_type:complete